MLLAQPCFSFVPFVGWNRRPPTVRDMKHRTIRGGIVVGNPSNAMTPQYSRLGREMATGIIASGSEAIRSDGFSRLRVGAHWQPLDKSELHRRLECALPLPMLIVVDKSTTTVASSHRPLSLSGWVGCCYVRVLQADEVGGSWPVLPLP